jgi:hypothetical protein
MLQQLQQSRYEVRLQVRVLDRQSREVLVAPVIFTTNEVPTFHYYTGSSEMLKQQLLHLARVRYVWYVKNQISEDFTLRRLLARRDWVLEIEEAECEITPPPTEEHRKKMFDLMSGAIFLPEKKRA